MWSSEVVVCARAKADVEYGIALIGQRSVVEATGCIAERRGNTWMFCMEHGGEPLLITQAIRDAVEETGCFALLEETKSMAQYVPAEGTGAG